MTSVMRKARLQRCTVVVQVQMLSICFQEMCSISSSVCVRVCVCIMKVLESLLYLFNVGGRGKGGYITT